MFWLIWGGCIAVLSIIAYWIAKRLSDRQVRLHGRVSAAWVVGAALVAVCCVVGLGVVAPIAAFMVAFGSYGSNK
ncbi:hypothetical protein GCM10027053_47390 [Intrasporangium mesophilum]